MGYSMSFHQFEPQQWVCHYRVGFHLNLVAAKAHILQMNRERWHHVIHGKPVEDDVVRSISDELGGAIDMVENAAMRFLNALGSSGASRGQLIENHVFRIRMMNIDGLGFLVQLLNRKYSAVGLRPSGRQHCGLNPVSKRWLELAVV